MESENLIPALRSLIRDQVFKKILGTKSVKMVCLDNIAQKLEPTFRLALANGCTQQDAYKQTLDSVGGLKYLIKQEKIILWKNALHDALLSSEKWLIYYIFVMFLISLGNIPPSLYFSFFITMVCLIPIGILLNGFAGRFLNPYRIVHLTKEEFEIHHTNKEEITIHSFGLKSSFIGCLKLILLIIAMFFIYKLFSSHEYSFVYLGSLLIITFFIFSLHSIKVTSDGLYHGLFRKNFIPFSAMKSYEENGNNNLSSYKKFISSIFKLNDINPKNQISINYSDSKGKQKEFRLNSHVNIELLIYKLDQQLDKNDTMFHER